MDDNAIQFFNSIFMWKYVLVTMHALTQTINAIHLSCSVKEMKSLMISL